MCPPAPRDVTVSTVPAPLQRVGQFVIRPRLGAPGETFPWSKAGINSQSLRAHRILAEIRPTTGGDVRRICDLFGIGIEAAMRNATRLGHPAFREEIAAAARSTPAEPPAD